MEKSERSRRDLDGKVEELMLVCDTSQRELSKLVSMEQVPRTTGGTRGEGGGESSEDGSSLSRTPWWRTT